MTPRQRVQAAFAHSEPDYPPADYFSTPEIQEALLAHFGLSDDDDLRDRLGTDIRYVNPPYIGPALPQYDDGSVMNEWGVLKKPMPNEYGDYAEAINFPYAGWKTVDEAEAFSWPDPNWYDYRVIPDLCAGYPDLAVATGSTSVQDFINNTAYGRGVEQVLLDIALTLEASEGYSSPRRALTAFSPKKRRSSSIWPTATGPGSPTTAAAPAWT